MVRDSLSGVYISLGSLEFVMITGAPCPLLKVHWMSSGVTGGTAPVTVNSMVTSDPFSPMTTLLDVGLMIGGAEWLRGRIK